MKRLTSIVLTALCLAGVAAGRDSDSNQFTVVSWNVDSGGADPHMVALRISEMKGVDVWGLCEVLDEFWAKLFEQAASDNEPGRFGRFLSPTGGSDRSCILYDRTKFECLGRFEFNWSGQPWYRHELGLRPGLVAHLRHRSSGQDLYFMVNRLYGLSADKQAAALTEWASHQDAPVLAMGTYDFAYRPEAELASPAGRRGYPVLTANGVFQWLMPDNPVQTVWRGNLDTIDDFILLADREHRLTGRSQIIVEPGDFPDTELTPDHRPVSATFTIRPVGR